MNARASVNPRVIAFLGVVMFMCGFGAFSVWLMMGAPL